MIGDKELMFSDNQAVTATAASTDVVDQGKKSNSYKRMFVRAVVKTTFAGGTSLKADLETSDTENFTSATVLCSSPVVAVADLVAGKELIKVPMPLGANRYLRMKYTVVGTMTAGAVDAGLVLDVDNH